MKSAEKFTIEIQNALNWLEEIIDHNFSKGTIISYDAVEATVLAKVLVDYIRKDALSSQPVDKCPQCGESTITANLGDGKTDTYCEECGWPDENREEQPIADEELRRAVEIVEGILECRHYHSLDFVDYESIQTLLRAVKQGGKI